MAINADILVSSHEQLSTLFQSVSHPMRVQILGLVLKGCDEFGELMQATGLSKTALARHLDRLMKNGILRRVNRGIYGFTKDGLDVVGSIVSLLEQLRRNWIQIGPDFMRRSAIKKTPSMRLGYAPAVSHKPATYACSNLTYLGSLTGVLQSLGSEDVTVSDVAGYTGLAFLVNVPLGRTDASAVNFHGLWSRIHASACHFGWELSRFVQPSPFPSSGINELSKADMISASEFFDKVWQGLVRTKRPVIVWGINFPDYGIVNATEGDSYVVSTQCEDCLSKGNRDLPVNFDSLVSPGRLEALFFEKQVEPPPIEESDKSAVVVATEFIGGRHTPVGRVQGPHAYREWASVLREKPEFTSYLGASYLGFSFLEANRLANKFLARLAIKYKQCSQGSHLYRASQAYSSIVYPMEQYVKLFPYAVESEISVKMRERGSKLLMDAAVQLEAAQECLLDAVRVWE